MKFTLKDRQSLVLGDDERIINATGRKIQLVVRGATRHCRVDKRRYPLDDQELDETDRQSD